MRRALKGKSPNLDIERSYWDAGYEIVAGLDELVKEHGQDRSQLSHWCPTATVG